MNEVNMTTTPETGRVPSPCTCDPATNVMCPHCTARFWKGQLAATRTLLDEAVGLVKRAGTFTWSNGSVAAWDCCTVCNANVGIGPHKPDCPLAAFLKKVEDADAHRTTK